MIGDSNDKGNFPHELLLTDRQVSSIRKAFSNDSLVNIRFKSSFIKNDAVRRISM